MAHLENKNEMLESLKSSFSNSEPFKLPNNYIEDLNKKIIDSTEGINSDKILPHTTLWIRLRPIMYMAAMFISLFLIIKYVVGDNGSSQKATDYADGKTTEIDVLHDYMASTIDEYSVYESYEEYSQGGTPIHEASFSE